MALNSVSLKNYCDAMQMVEVLVRNGYESHITPVGYNEEFGEYESFIVDFVADSFPDECDGDCENCPYAEEIDEPKKEEELFKNGSPVSLEDGGKHFYGLISVVYPKSLTKSGSNEYDVVIPILNDEFTLHVKQEKLTLIK